MIGKEYHCKIHGKYIQRGESKGCPECEYHQYILEDEGELWYEYDNICSDEEPY